LKEAYIAKKEQQIESVARQRIVLKRKRNG